MPLQLKTIARYQIAQKNKNNIVEKIVSLAKRKGFVFQSSEIYGGLNGCWDYGPLGIELLKNIKDKRGFLGGIDTDIIRDEDRD